MDENKKNSKRGFYKKARYIPEEERRADIVEAARRVFEEKGYYKTKIDDIAAKAGLSHGTIYRYFPSKDALATEIIADYGAIGYLEVLKEKNILHTDPAVVLKSMAKAYYRNVDERLPLIRFRITEAVSQAELGRNYYRNIHHRLFLELTSIFKEYQNRGLFKKGDPFIMGHILYGMLFGFLYCQELILGKELDPLDMKKVIPQIVDYFLHGVAIAPAKSTKKYLTRPK
jgi:AcrR family transcriptional regulator